MDMIYNTMNVAQAMREIAAEWHPKGVQPLRKYTGEPYVVHTQSVADTYYGYFPGDLIGKAIAEGHDLLEDTPITSYEILRQLLLKADTSLGVGIEIVDGIIDLTDVFIPNNYPKLSRAERKEGERFRLGKVSGRSQNIKVCDLIDNTESIVEHDANFARVYLREKELLLRVLTAADNRLRERAYRQVIGGIAYVTTEERRKAKATV
jgi:hypothetical protein